MGSFTASSVVLVRFPFSDLSQSKLRPAVVLADCGHGDWLLCQITSKAYADARVVQINDDDFLNGSLCVTSFARPAKLFTAHHTLIASSVGVLRDAVLNRIVDEVIRLLRRTAGES
jgi:mRNA interferase MazF